MRYPYQTPENKERVSCGRTHAHADRHSDYRLREPDDNPLSLDQVSRRALLAQSLKLFPYRLVLLGDGRIIPVPFSS